MGTRTASPRGHFGERIPMLPCWRNECLISRHKPGTLRSSHPQKLTSNSQPTVRVRVEVPAFLSTTIRPSPQRRPYCTTVLGIGNARGDTTPLPNRSILRVTAGVGRESQNSPLSPHTPHLWARNAIIWYIKKWEREKRCCPSTLKCLDIVKVTAEEVGSVPRNSTQSPHTSHIYAHNGGKPPCANHCRS